MEDESAVWVWSRSARPRRTVLDVCVDMRELTDEMEPVPSRSLHDEGHDVVRDQSDLRRGRNKMGRVPNPALEEPHEAPPEGYRGSCAVDSWGQNADPGGGHENFGA